MQHQLNRTRSSVHQWGKRNRVTFDPAKEHTVVIHPTRGVGADFKLLGCLVDHKLLMVSAINATLAKARPKVTSLLRMRGFTSFSDMINQYKTHIWSSTEYVNGWIYHAAPTHLEKFDKLQEHFLHGLQSNAAHAFKQENFAPPTLRRDIGMLGLIHKRVLGLAHPAFDRLLPLQPASYYEANAGNPFLRHDKQIYNHNRECSNNAMFQRSIFSLISLYIRLPQRIINKDTISTFQSELTFIAKRRCRDGTEGWQFSFNATYHASHFFTVADED